MDRGLILALAGLLLAGPPAVQAQAVASGERGAALGFDLERVRATKRVTAVRVSEPIRLDGVLDDAAWRLAEPAIEFFQQEPVEFQRSARRTEVRFVYDDTTLYIGALMHGQAPDLLITNELKRDFNGRNGDMFGLVLDTFRDGRTAYGFITNPGGAQRETQAFDNGRRNDASWHGVWFARTAVLPDGWSVEYAIPFRTLRFRNRDAQEWGVNLVRIMRRDNETVTWAPVPRQFTHYAVSYAGTLEGIEGVRPGHNLQVTPFVSGQFGDVPGRGDRRPGDAGLDLKWGVTPSLVLDATVRTDFSQVEVDEQQINLTRFSLFFPEKRTFFLESPASFQVGLADRNDEDRRDVLPFFSRRIGLAADGVPIPVLGGLRLTGRAGRQDLGLLMMQTGADGERPGDRYSAARVSRTVADGAYLGAFYFGREAVGTADFNRVAGVDLRLAPRPTLEIEAFAMRSASAGASGDWAGRAGFRVDHTRHRAAVGAVHVGESFQNDLGFIRRAGAGTLFGRYARVLRPSSPSRVLEHIIGVSAETAADARYRTVLTGIGTVNYGLQFTDGSELKGHVGRTFERVTEETRIAGIPLAPGTYRFGDAGVSYASNLSSAISGGFEAAAGSFWSGRQRQIKGNIRIRINAHVAAAASYGRSSITLPEGSFVADLVGMRLDWSFTPRMFLNAFVQYNGGADAWISNVRYNLIHRPLSDIYVVWNETRLPGATRRALMLKYTHLIAF